MGIGNADSMSGSGWVLLGVVQIQLVALTPQRVLPLSAAGWFGRGPEQI